MITPPNNYGLQKLSGSKFEIADGQSDIRKWVVKDDTGRKLGMVTELLFDEQKLKVRYLILDTSKNEFELFKRKVAVPIGVAKVHELREEVSLPNVLGSQIEALPDYQDEDMSLDSQYEIRGIFDVSLALPVRDDVLYDHPIYNEQKMYRK